MGSIRERAGAKKYQARYRDPSGKLRSSSFERKSDAKQFLREVETDKARRLWVDPDLARTSFAEWAEKWSETIVHLKPKTQLGYRDLMRLLLLPEFGETPLGRIEPIQVRQWVAKLHARDLSASRIRQAYRLLSMILKAAVESGYIAKSPCVGVRLPKVISREVQVLTADEVHALAMSAPEPYDTLIYLLAFGGVRWGEAAALRRKRCDLLRSRLEVAESLADVNGHLIFGETKTHLSRSIVVPAFLKDMLARHLAENVAPEADALVFTSARGGPLRYGNFRRAIWLPAREAAGISDTFTPHHLRHTCAALLIAQGAHPKAIQSHLGHASIVQTLDTYGHLFPIDTENLASGLDATYREAKAKSDVAQMWPKGGNEVVALDPKRASDQG